MIRCFQLNDTTDTELAAKCFAEVVVSGDVILLQGVVGAGKTDFARRLIQTRQSEFGIVGDVPSPTFTLVQTYDLVLIQIWHADLYRLTDVDELYELGLEAAFEEAVCLVEWPERLGDQAPQDAIWLHFEITGENTRVLHLEWTDSKWNTVADIMALMLTEVRKING